MIKRSITLFVIAFFSLASIVSAKPLKFGILPVIDTLPLQVAAKEGYFKKHNLEVELISFMSANERNTAVYADQLDGFFGDLIATLLIMDKKVSKGFPAPVKVINISYSTNPKQRMFALVTAPKLNLSNKKQLTVAISKASIIEYLLSHFETLPVAGKYEYLPVEIKKMPIRVQMLLSGKIESALLPEPLVSLAESKGAKVLDTDQTLGMPLTNLALSTSAIKYQDAFLKSYSLAVQALRDNPEKYRSLMAKTCRIPKPLVKDFPVYKFPFPRIPTKQEVDQVQTWMIKSKLINNKIPYATVVP